MIPFIESKSKNQVFSKMLSSNEKYFWFSESRYGSIIPELQNRVAHYDVMSQTELLTLIFFCEKNFNIILE